MVQVVQMVMLRLVVVGVYFHLSLGGQSILYV